MEFRKQVNIEKAKNDINYNAKLLFLGSCFAENIGNKLLNASFSIVQNPQGIIFNPLALANVFENYKANEIVERGERFYSWRNHSNNCNKDKSLLEKSLIEQKSQFQNQLSETTHAFVTFGSAWGYRHQALGFVVANCHKMPQQNFTKELVTMESVVAVWSKIIQENPQINWVFTVSPVRHWKDGVRENNVSKGVLHQSIHSLLQLSNVSYFPSYEIILDELRDYRFFKNDMLHPNELAVEYVWEKFQFTYFNDYTKQISLEVDKLNRMEGHRTLNDNPAEHAKFLETLNAQKSKVAELLKR